jgi:galactose oxidase
MGSQNHLNVEILTPPYLLDSNGTPAVRPILLDSPDTFEPGDVLEVQVDTSGSHTFALTRLGAATHTINLDCRRVPLAVISQQANAFGLHVPTNPIHVPPGLYWLFAMNEAGVPSVGWTILRTLS